MTATDKLDLQMQEDADGSAVVSLPPGESPNEGQTASETTTVIRDDDGDDDDGVIKVKCEW